MHTADGISGGLCYPRLVSDNQVGTVHELYVLTAVVIPARATHRATHLSKYHGRDAMLVVLQSVAMFGSFGRIYTRRDFFGEM